MGADGRRWDENLSADALNQRNGGGLSHMDGVHLFLTDARFIKIDAKSLGQWEWIWVVAREELDELGDSQGLGNRRDLQHRPDPSAALGIVGGAVEHPYTSLKGFSQPEKQVDGGRLSGAVGSQNGQDLAGPGVLVGLLGVLLAIFALLTAG